MINDYFLIEFYLHNINITLFLAIFLDSFFLKFYSILISQEHLYKINMLFYFYFKFNYMYHKYLIKFI
jgi:hypothetical protein